ncbi:MAG: RNA polymerase factor sigma-54 [Spirochaetaceae bacterium]|jgi:RNA polymerase sigma-54 factor|nr:RNA polymerase factor sigma-54 [Spirochaetaceae bacterium]
MQVQRLDIAQQQKLKLTPQLIQSIRLMTMPAAELRERIAEELERNPALELAAPERNDIEYKRFNSDAEASFAGEPDTAYPDISYGEFSGGSARGAEAADAHQMFIEGAISRSESLQEHLLAQLPELPLSEEVSGLAEMIIQNLDGRGFHLVPPETLPGALVPEGALAPDGTIRRNLLDEALCVVRRLDPLGTGCTDFQESLLFQAEYYDGAPALALTILRDHIGVLEKPRSDVVARKLKVSREAAEEALDFIRTLDPFPGSCFDSESSGYIIPDVTVRKGEEGFIALINDEEIPVLGISPLFMKLSRGGQGNTEARDFARESVKEARWFMGSINQRNHTLLKVVRMLIIFQEDFFLKGPAYLRPLRLQDVAAEIGVHEATVSRIAGGKYLQCDWGLFELKYFFSSGVHRKGSVSGAVYPPSGKNRETGPGARSREAVKQLLREIIGRDSTLSDRELSEKLAEQGISVARRTVAKYRTELTIGSSFDR